jgi:hypothetical protein
LVSAFPRKLFNEECLSELAQEIHFILNGLGNAVPNQLYVQITNYLEIGVHLALSSCLPHDLVVKKGFPTLFKPVFHAAECCFPSRSNLLCSIIREFLMLQPKVFSGLVQQQRKVALMLHNSSLLLALKLLAQQQRKVL